MLGPVGCVFLQTAITFSIVGFLLLLFFFFLTGNCGPFIRPNSGSIELFTQVQIIMSPVVPVTGKFEGHNEV